MPPFFNPRVQRQFSGLFDPGPMQPQPQDDYFSELRRLHSQPTPALDEYRQLLTQAPSPEEHRPNWWTRIAAGLTGLGAGLKNPGEGVQAAAHVNRMGYDRALSDYYDRLKPAQAAAEIERNDIDTQLKYLLDANELGLKYEDYKRKWSNDATRLGFEGRKVGLEEEKFDFTKGNTQKRTEIEERNVNSLIDYRKTLGNTNWFNANTNRMNANTNRQNADSLDTHRGRQWILGLGNLGARNRAIDQRTATTRAMTPSMLEKAEASAMSYLRTLYPKWIIQNGGYLELTEPPAVGTPEYEEYNRMLVELNAEVQRRMQGQVGYGIEDEESPYDMIGVIPE